VQANALCAAAFRGEVTVGADVSAAALNTGDAYLGLSPLMWAVLFRAQLASCAAPCSLWCSGRTDALQTLIAAGADINLADPSTGLTPARCLPARVERSSCDLTACVCAVQLMMTVEAEWLEGVRVLLAVGADVNVRWAPAMQTVLHMAVPKCVRAPRYQKVLTEKTCRRNEELLRILLEARPDMNAADAWNNVPVMDAISRADTASPHQALCTPRVTLTHRDTATAAAAAIRRVYVWSGAASDHRVVRCVDAVDGGRAAGPQRHVRRLAWYRLPQWSCVVRMRHRARY
jgi:hypothetical protein